MKFEGRDFLYFNKHVIPGNKDSLDCIADLAQEKFDKWLVEQPVVRSPDKEHWAANEDPADNFVARLVYIEPIEKQKCEKHEAPFYRTAFDKEMAIMGDKVRCINCGIKLNQRWEPADV